MDDLNTRHLTFTIHLGDFIDREFENIDRVMAAQADLVEPLASFHPRMVKMAPPGERPED